MVHRAMMKVMMPAKDVGTASSSCMTGQPEPTSESGRPRLTKAR